MKPILAFLLLLGIALSSSAQRELDPVTEALKAYKDNSLYVAQQKIEEAMASPSFSTQTKTHVFRGYIYKDLYKQNKSLAEADSFRMASIRSFMKVIKMNTESGEKEFNEDAKKTLKYLSSTSYNDAALALDAMDFEQADQYFKTYTDIQTFLGFDIENRMEEYDAYKQSLLEKNQKEDPNAKAITATELKEVADVKQEQSEGEAVSAPTEPETIEASSFASIQNELNSLASTEERYIYLSQILQDQAFVSKWSTDDQIELLYTYARICSELFKANSATVNPYPYYEKGIEAIDKAIALDNNFQNPKLPVFKKRLNKLKIEVDKQQREIAETKNKKTIVEDEAFEALDHTIKALKYYQAKDLLKAEYQIEQAMADSSLMFKQKTWYFAGYIYKDLYKLHRLDGSGGEYRWNSINAFFCSIEMEGDTGIKTDAKKSLKYLAATIYNDAAYALDTSNFSAGLMKFEAYKYIMGRINPEYDLTQREIEFDLYLASKYEQKLDTLEQWDTTTARIIEDLYAEVLQMDERNESARYNGYNHAMKSQKFRNQLLSQVRRENELNKAESQRQRTQILAMGGGLVMLLLLAGISFRAYRQKRKDNDLIAAQKEEVERQHEQLEEKNKEITDSITYAKRIQEAILPPGRLVKEYLTDSFILYKPKDIVAGDFYWMEPHGDWTIFAAADCTGHGVPGAMVSVVCSNALNRAVREFGLLDPAKILDKTLEIVLERFEKSEEEVKDGMDISLCALNTKTNELLWSGAQNPLWLVTKRNPAELSESETKKLVADDYNLYEVKADKQPIGKYHDPSPFTGHKIQLEAGDSIYIFSDGYPDQFGGPKGKKLKTRAFKELVLSMQDQPIQAQHKIINEHFEEWRGDLEQIDDVCIIGVKV